jgi:hypothetical protein
VASAVWKARTTSSRLRAALVGLALVVAGIVGVAPAAAGQFTSPSATPIYAYDTSGPLAHETAGDSAATVTASPTRRRLPDGASARGIGLVVAADTAAPAVEDTTAVIGRLPDTAVAKSWPGHEVLDLPDWSIAKNDQWVQSVIDRKMPVYVGSNPTWENIWDAANARTTVFGREFRSSQMLVHLGWLDDALSGLGVMW